MAPSPHLVRRGAVYYWRRRFAAPSTDERTVILTISLFTKEKGIARRRGAELTLMSEELMEGVRRGRLTADEAKAILLAVARRHMAKLDLHAVTDRQRTTPEPMSGERADRVIGAIYRLLAERGRAAALTEADAPFLGSCGLGPEEATQVAITLSVLRDQNLVPPAPWKLMALLEEHAPEVEPTALAMSDVEHAYYRGMAAASLNTGARWGATLDRDLAALRSDLEKPSAAPPNPGSGEVRQAPEAPTVISPPPPPPLGAASLPASDAVTIFGLAEGLVALKLKKGEWTPKTARQMRQTASLFVKITARQHLGDVRQADMARFADTLLLQFPKGYGKSARDAAKSLDDLLAAAQDLPDTDRGLDGATVNRHLSHFGNLLEFAEGRGIRPAEQLNLTKLRSKKKGRDRDARPAFTPEQMKVIFQSPVWRGSQSEKHRLLPGQIVIHDALYWVPLIAAYGLMRREEICGLMVEDVALDGPIPYFNIRPNAYRRLKNVQSNRKVPIHPELLRLGLLQFVRAVAERGYDLLFPELLPATGMAALGDQFYDVWTPVLHAQLPAASNAGLVFHSIRHYGNDALVDAGVPVEWRQDLLGHGGSSEAEERYREEVRLNRKMTALGKLPLVTTDLEVFPVRLRRSVQMRQGRRARSRRQSVGI